MLSMLPLSSILTRPSRTRIARKGRTGKSQKRKDMERATNEYCRADALNLVTRDGMQGVGYFLPTRPQFIASSWRRHAEPGRKCIRTEESQNMVAKLIFLITEKGGPVEIGKVNMIDLSGVPGLPKNFAKRHPIAPSASSNSFRKLRGKVRGVRGKEGETEGLKGFRADLTLLVRFSSRKGKSPQGIDAGNSRFSL